MPALVGQHDGLRRPAGRQHGDGALVDAALDLLPLAVEAAERPGQLHGAGGVVGQKQLGRHVHLAHAPGGVDARRERIADRPRGDGALLHGAFGHQRGDADALRVGQRPQAAGDHRAVLARQRHDVRDGAEAQKITVLVQQLLLVALDGGGQLERDADARHLRDGLGLVLAVRVDERRGLRQLGFALVVVGDDKIDAELFAQLRLLIGRDAAVDRHDQLHALLFERVDGERVEPVALLEPRGDIAGHVAAPAAQIFRQQAGGRDAVNVIIAEDGDMLAALQGKPYARGGLVHVEQVERGGEGVAAG